MAEQAVEELDLTNSHLPSLAEVNLSHNLKYLDLTANRLRELEPKLLELSGLKRLSMRQNVLASAAPIGELQSKTGLEELDLRDNQLTQIPDLDGFSALRILELSYNEIRSLAPLSQLHALSLTELFVASNKVTAIESLSTFTNLKLLELGCNRIRRIENLGSQGALEELWLGRNRLSSFENMNSLTNLRRLSLQSNRLTSMAGLQSCTSLEELYLSHNGIQKMEGLSDLRRLRILDLSNNHLTAVEDLESCSLLTDLWLNDNQMPSLDPLAGQLSACRTSLTCIYLHNNPAAEHPQYKSTMLHLLPNLQQLDSDLVEGAA